MRIQSQLSVLVAILILSSVALADDKAPATGTWKWSSQGRQGNSIEWTLKLVQEGDKVTGVVVGGFNAATETPITEGSIKDGTITFTVVRERNDQKFVTKYSGKLDGDTITGKTERERNGQTTSTDWVAKRSTDATTKPTT